MLRNSVCLGLNELWKKQHVWAILLLDRDALLLLEDSALIIFVLGHFGECHTPLLREGRQGMKSLLCQMHHIHASPSPSNSLDHLTSKESHLWALCKKQRVISALRGMILPRRKPLGQRCLFSLPSSPWCSRNRFGSPLLRWRLCGGLSPTCWCGFISILSALAQGSTEHSCAVQWNAFPASCTQTIAYSTLTGCSGKFMYNFSLFGLNRNAILQEKRASTELDSSKNGSYWGW